MVIVQPVDALLEACSVLPHARPFSAGEARDSGVTWRQLRELVATGVLVHPIRGAYAMARLDDTLALRIAMLRLVVPATSVITDRTAAWLWGATTALAPNDHLRVPQVSVFSPPGHRLRNGLVEGGERGLALSDVAEVDGLCVTTALRTACDLGRLLHRDQAFAAMDALAALRHFSVERLVAEVVRFKGYRGVIQLRELAPRVDRGAQSQPESILRLRWYDEGLPRPECQVEVEAPSGSYFIDIGNREHGIGAEYDGGEFHGDDQREHDEFRRTWIEQQGWTLIVVRKENLFGHHQDVDRMLRRLK